MRSDFYQIVLIIFGLIVSALFGVFLYRELFPEYRIYQKDYVALEEFRSTYTGQPPPAFQLGVKQIVIANPDKGPETIDRCISCHVALQFPDFSPTKVAYDINGNLMLNEEGWPLKIPNENYVWDRLDQKVKELRDEKVLEQLKEEGESSKIAARLSEADRLESLKTAKVGHHEYDVTKVLQAHPLIGRETRPFEYHSIDDYGCVSCHSGNGRGLVTDKAHGPVFDGTYEEEFMGVKPQFLEKDPLNDPKFASVFNAKPGHGLLFQTTPILVGTLMQAKCVQCHQSSEAAMLSTASDVQVLANRSKEKSKAINTGFEREKEALLSQLELTQQIKSEGLEKAKKSLKQKSEDLSLSQTTRSTYQSQLKYLQGKSEEESLKKLNRQIINSLGSPGLAKQLEQEMEKSQNPKEVFDGFLKAHLDDDKATGTLFVKLARLNLEEAIKLHIHETEKTFNYTASNQKVISAMQSDVDYLTQGYQNGQHLFVSQACYACHRISGFARGGIGPELSEEGDTYPWFIKESIVWPQADLKTSTMPNYHLDHEETEALMTYLLAQKKETQVKSATQKKIEIQEWEQGKKLPFEKPVTPVQMKNLDYSMTVFATEGCAACHRLKGFESNVGFAIEKNSKVTPRELYKERKWFSKLFPEEIKGSEIVKAIEEHTKEIDEKISNDVRKDSLLEKIEKEHPGIIEGFYSDFKYAFRAKNHEATQKAENAKNPVEKAKALAELEAWKKRVHRILMIYVQEYGLGRLIGPRPNWSGVYRSDEWLMEHFRNPGALVARSIMPVFPFDDTKFYALTHMLDVLGKKNRDEVNEIWKLQGFDPQEAVKIFCSQCHGDFLEGNGPVATWIYPIPKNLRNAQFLRNLTKERVIQSIIHGVNGTPMPPWGEVATDKPTSDGIPVITRDQATQIVDWLFSTLPGSQIIRTGEEVPKWQYTPEKVLEELKEEGNEKKFLQPKKETSELSFLPTGENYYASLKPMVATTSVTDVFEVTEAPIPGEEEKGYYIKKEYYTPENLMQGQHFFEVNCAVCHGKEGEGSGQRAEFLKEAKPRMLTNLNWIETRDDLRLLQSIKFGVPGTSMTPWGDLTSSLQRLQLVMFIRTLSQEPERRNKLFNALYQGFNRADLVIEEARVNQYKKIEEVKKEIAQANEQLSDKELSPEKAGEIYTKQLKLKEQLEQYLNQDQLLITLKKEVKSEREIYQSLGVTLIGKLSDEETLQNLTKLIRLNEGRYTLKEGNLELNWDESKEKQIRQISKNLIDEVKKTTNALTEEKKRLENRMSSASRDLELNNIIAEMSAYQKLEQQVTAGVEEVLRSVKKQNEIYNRYKGSNDKL